MVGTGRGDASIQQFFLPTPHSSPAKKQAVSLTSDPLVGDGFTSQEVQEALKPKPIDSWHPDHEYVDCGISALQPGPQAVTFMGRIANIYDVVNTPKTPRSAKGCVKLCVKDCDAAITVRLWYASRMPNLRLGQQISIWTNHISNGESGTLSSSSAPLFASLFPERDRNCHLMVHNHSDNGMFRIPLGYRAGLPLNGLMTLQNFIDGGYDVIDAKILVVVKSIGAKKKVTRKDESTVENINLQVHDDTAEATLGLWGTLAFSPFGQSIDASVTDAEESTTRHGWVPGETVLLMQAPGWKFGRTTYLSFTSTTILDIDPDIPDADWLRRWALRQKSREAINPPFPEDVFEIDALTIGPIRCLFTIGELDEFARCAPNETFQGYLSIIIMETKLLDLWRRNMLLSNECCNIPIYANALTVQCKGCDQEVQLRLNPKILGQVIDETGSISAGKMLFSDQAWRNLLGRGPNDLLQLGYEEIKYLADRLLFCRVSLMFGWTGDERKAGGRVCVLGVRM
ncbi:hypothetical protein M409DRAFT_62645 [Zasmidium cellare ATCC 36951]|uniref:Uncharacterized protein n=1 Tax=Zasmidium cellare ATCC 36951 TaxID=1080233 RepID=A0A6A6D3H9_ZASCE|nr:uncharacterized protein M409DRAFT_62645 [Zasmidium cellare ATCC 36951]KAF2173008.1 hypothetical protein M409DRAFT_62645 [Zasmidium cellare ATCC 36951]